MQKERGNTAAAAGGKAEASRLLRAEGTGADGNAVERDGLGKARPRASERDGDGQKRGDVWRALPHRSLAAAPREREVTTGLRKGVMPRPQSVSHRR